MAIFRFKKFDVRHERSAMKVGTDGVLLGAWAEVANANHILDIGAGTGLIAMMLAQRTTNTTIVAVEIDESASGEMRLNFSQCPWKDSLHAVKAEIQTFESSRSFDLIVTNPPYFQKGTLPPTTARKSARHENTLTQQDLLKATDRLLSPHGRLCIILPVQEALKFEKAAQQYSLHLNKVLAFHSKMEKTAERLLMEFSRNPCEKKYTKLVHYTDNGEWTDEYKRLTRDFYIKL